MSSYTSNSDKKQWKGFISTMVLWFLGLCAFVYLLIILVDPFDTLPLSLPLDRAPMATNQRFSYPVLARNPQFDSVVVGSSSSRLFRPELLNEVFAANFVNLAINAGRPYEQYKFLKLFLEHHKSPKTILIGMDIRNKEMWCRENEMDVQTDRQFPEWMFDSNPWNDYLYHFNAKALEISGRQLAQVLGFMEPRFSKEGFDDFTPPIDQYDLRKARKYIYGEENPIEKAPEPGQPELSEEELNQITYPTLSLLEDMLAEMPDETKKILLFVPRHWYVQPSRNTKEALILEECKSRIIEIASKYNNAHVFDFARESPITTEDKNYWDIFHYTIVIADNIINMIAGKMYEDINNEEYYDYYATK